MKRLRGFYTALFLILTVCVSAPTPVSTTPPTSTETLTPRPSPTPTEEFTDFWPTPTFDLSVDEFITTEDTPNGKWQLIFTSRSGPQVWEFGWDYSNKIEIVSIDKNVRYVLAEDEGMSRPGFDGPLFHTVLWSADGNRLYYSWYGYQSTMTFAWFWDLKVIDLTTGEIYAFSPEIYSPFTISPEEEYLVYIPFRDEKEFIEILNLKDHSTRTIELDVPGERGYLVWSSDSLNIALLSVTGNYGEKEYLITLIDAKTFEMSTCTFMDRIVPSEWNERGFNFKYVRTRSPISPRSDNLPIN